jgi:uncharacterized small protein (DUF1192 family)
MSCGHGWHGCGPWHGGPYGGGWYEPADWYGEADWPVRRRAPRYRRMESETATDELEARLAELRDEIRRVEADLGSLRGSGAAAERP